MPNPAAFARNQDGISLIETLLSITIILVLAASFSQLLTSFFQNYEVQEAIAEIQQQRRVTTDLLWQEIRNAGLDPTGELFNPTKKNKTKLRKKGCVKIKHEVEPIFAATATVFHFLADLNQNGVVDDSKGPDDEEHIRYEWVGADGHDVCWKSGKPKKKAYTLFRDSGSGLQEVSSNVIAFKLVYFDEDGVELELHDKNGIKSPDGALDKVQRGKIRRAVLSLTTRTPKALENGYRTRSISTEIWLRNIA